MIKIYKMPDGSIVFKGKEAIYRPCPKIDVRDVLHDHFEVPSKDTSVEKVDEHLEGIIKDLPFKNDRLTFLAIAVSEAVNNAINQGKDNPDQIVSVDVIYLPKVMLYVFIRDSAGKLNIEDINLGISDTFETDESGRGFFIMTHYCSVVAYCCDDKSEISSNQKEIILGLEPENGE